MGQGRTVRVTYVDFVPTGAMGHYGYDWSHGCGDWYSYDGWSEHNNYSAQAGCSSTVETLGRRSASNEPERNHHSDFASGPSVNHYRRHPTTERRC